VQIRELKVPDSFEITPKIIGDDRGSFMEWYRFDKLEEFRGHSIDLRQGNMSVSKRGVVRGIHFADVPRGQAKYVMATSGSVIDYIIDVRVGSPTFGQWDSVLLDTVSRKAVYLAEGLGHAFVSLEDGSTVSYLVSDLYRPDREHAVSPLDADVALNLPDGVEPLISQKDADAPTLADARRGGLLPSYEECLAYYEARRSGAQA